MKEKADEIELFVADLKSTCKAPSHNRKQSPPHMFLGRVAHTLMFSEALLEQFFDPSSKFGWDYIIPADVLSKKNLFCVLQCMVSLRGKLLCKSLPAVA